MVFLLILGAFVVISTISCDGATPVLLVAENGLDGPRCLQGYIPCRSLSYVLNHLQFGNVSWTVFVYKSQNLFNVTDRLDLGNGNLSVIGTGWPFCRIDFGDLRQVSNFQKLTFHNLTLVKLPQIHHGKSVGFYDSLVVVNAFYQGDQFFNLFEVNSLRCEFLYIMDYSMGVYSALNFRSVSKQYFSDCIFKNNGFYPFLFFKSAETKPLVSFNGCGFLLTGEKFLVFYYSFQSIWMTFMGNFKIMINNIQISNSGTYKESNTIITGGNDLDIEISNSLFSHNLLPLTDDVSAIISLKYFKSVKLFNVTFDSNVGTSIYVSNGNLTLHNVSFINNTGLHTGGIAITSSFYSFTHFDKVTFDNNKFTATYGGAIYIQSNPCNIYIYQSDLNFRDGTQYIFYSVSQSKCISSLFEGLNTNNLKTMPNAIRMYNSTIDVFPGQLISIGSLNITDQFGHDTHCTAKPYIKCANISSLDCRAVGIINPGVVFKKNEVTLKGERLVFIQSAHNIQTNLYFASKVEPSLLQKDLNMSIHCATVNSQLNVVLRPCPLGYTFTPLSEGGVCAKATNDSNIVYDEASGVVCIKLDYWYGEIPIKGKGVNITAPCSLPYCANSEACPIIGFTDSHYRLPWVQDEQCNGLYGGMMCKSCARNSSFTFGATRCLKMSECRENWKPYVIIVLAVVGQVVLTVFLIYSKFVTESGVGYLYGPLFFLAVYKLLPISHSLTHTSSHLDIVFSFYQSILFMNLDILGRIPWCFFQGVDQTLIYSFRFLGPLVTFVSLLVITLIAKINICSQRLKKLLRSPIQPMCLLMVLSFWSLSYTSIEIIKPVIVTGNWRFAIQPEYEYLENVYAVTLWCIGMALMLFIYFPFILMLFFSQCLRARCNLSRIQPLLDGLQSSYKSSCQWYSGVYFLAWIVLSINMPLYLFVIVFGAVSMIHFLVQPHRKRFLNISETILLVDLMILASLSFLCDHEYCSNTIMAMNYPFLVPPLLYMLLGGIWLAFKDKIQKWKNAFTESRRQHKLTNVVSINEVLDREDRDIHSNMKPNTVLEVMMEREPLIFED